MELQCPGCQKKLAIADQHAGQMIKCPSCGGMFMAPALPAVPTLPPVMTATPIAPAAPSSSSDGPGTIPLAPAHPVPPPPLHTDAVSATPPPPPPPVAKKPVEMEMELPSDLPPGDFSRTRIIQLVPTTVCWFAPVGCALIFFLSFGKWMGNSNLWELFGGGDTAIIFYALLTIFLGLPLAWLKLAFDKGWLPKQDFLRPIWPWRSLIVAGILGAGFLILAVLWIMANLSSHVPAMATKLEDIVALPSTLALMALSMKLGVRIHLIALLGSLSEFWLERRRKKRLPLPEVTIRW